MSKGRGNKYDATCIFVIKLLRKGKQEKKKENKNNKKLEISSADPCTLAASLEADCYARESDFDFLKMS